MVPLFAKLLTFLVFPRRVRERLRKRIAEAGETKRVDVTVEFAKNHGFKVDAKDVRGAY